MAIAFVSTTVSAKNMVVASGSTATCISKDDNGSVSGLAGLGSRMISHLPFSGSVSDIVFTCGYP